MKNIIFTTTVLSALTFCPFAMASDISIPEIQTSISHNITILNNDNIIEKMNAWGLPITVDLSSKIKVYDMLQSFSPLFKNLPDSLITDNGIQLDGENAKYYSILKNMLISASGETIINIIMKQYVFTLLYQTGDKTSDSVDNRMLTAMDNNPDVMYGYYTYFVKYAQENNLSIEISYNTQIHAGEKDTNHNRAKLYSILNNVPFLLNATNKFNKGIFDRSNQSPDLILNNKFNISYYENNEFLNKRIMFNYIYFEHLLINIEKYKKKEIKNIFPIVYNNDGIDINGVFVESHKYYEKSIYINSKPENIQIGPLKKTYFLLDNHFNIKQDNLTIYVLADYANIATSLNSQNIVIYPLNSSLRTTNLTNEFSFKNTIILNKYFIGNIDIENNPLVSSSINIILPETFNDLFAYDYQNNHLFIKNQHSVFKATKNTIFSLGEKMISFDQIVAERNKNDSENNKYQFIFNKLDIK